MVYHLNLSLSHFLRPHTDKIAISLAATIFFLYGSQIHDLVKGLIKDLPFLVRLAILVLVCAFGYGLIAVAFTKLCELGLSALSDMLLAPVVSGLFLLIGLLAEKKKAM
jgi:hypothetical protein